MAAPIFGGRTSTWVFLRQKATSLSARAAGLSLESAESCNPHLLQVMPYVLHHLELELALPAVRVSTVHSHLPDHKRIV